MKSLLRLVLQAIFEGNEVPNCLPSMTSWINHQRKYYLRYCTDVNSISKKQYQMLTKLLIINANLSLMNDAQAENAVNEFHE